MAREMLLAGISEEELKPTPKLEPPKTPKGKLENFWYHYKWAFLGGAFAVMVLAVLIGQMLSVNKPDYSMLLVTERSYMDAQLNVLEQTLAKYGQDLDEDGTVEVQIINAYLGGSGGNQQYANTQMVQAHLWAGDVMLFAWEPAYYEQFMTNVNENSTEDYRFLSKLTMDSEGIREDGVSWDWSKDPRRTADEGLKLFPEQLYFGVRTVSGTAEDSETMQKQCMELLQAFILDQPTQQPTKPAE